MREGKKEERKRRKGKKGIMNDNCYDHVYFYKNQVSSPKPGILQVPNVRYMIAILVINETTDIY